MDMRNMSLLRAIFEQISRTGPLPIASQCFECGAIIQGMLSPNAEPVQIMECPNCHSLGLMFGSNFLPVSREVMGSNDSEAKRKHLVGVLMKTLHGQLFAIITEIVGTEKDNCEECGQPKPVSPPSVAELDNMFSTPLQSSKASGPVPTQGGKELSFSKDDAKRIQDAYISLGVKLKESPNDSMLQMQFGRQQALYEKTKHLL